MRAIADGLAARGLVTRLHESRAGLDVTALTRPAGGRATELVIDEDGYTELHYWNQAGAGAEQIVTVALRALDAVTPGTRPAAD